MGSLGRMRHLALGFCFRYKEKRSCLKSLFVAQTFTRQRKRLTVSGSIFETQPVRSAFLLCLFSHFLRRHICMLFKIHTVSNSQQSREIWLMLLIHIYFQWTKIKEKFLETPTYVVLCKPLHWFSCTSKIDLLSDSYEISF